MRDLDFVALRPEHLLAIRRQPSQTTLLGMDGHIGPEDTAMLCGGISAWAAVRGSEVVACFGVVEQFAGVQGLAWCLLSDNVGASHLQLTRFVREEALRVPLPRLELLAQGPDLEQEISRCSPLDSGQIVALAEAKSTPQVRWARLIGFTPVHVLRFFGGACETYVLCERLDPRLAPPFHLREAA